MIEGRVEAKAAEQAKTEDLAQIEREAKAAEQAKTEDLAQIEREVKAAGRVRLVEQTRENAKAVELAHLDAEAKAAEEARSKAEEEAKPIKAKLDEEAEARVNAAIEEDYKRTAELYLRVAKQGNAEAQNSLGVMYANGQGVPLDDKAAVTWYRKAAKQGNAEAQFHLGEMYDLGRGVQQNKKIAAEWYSKAASQGYTNNRANTETEDSIQTQTAPHVAASLGSKGEPDTRTKESQATEAEQTALEMVLERSVKNWATAWSANNINDYLAAYVSDFKPEGMSHDAWKQQRIKRISKPRIIEVTLSDINLSIQDDNHATVSFIQNYHSGKYQNKTKKILRMIRQLDRWLIAEEVAVK